jgi:polar amino acid transport system substrate-binding protein
VSVEVGQELARRLGVPYELVEYQRVAEVVDSLKTQAADFTINNATPERMQYIDFTRPVLAIELGYLAPAGSPIAKFEDIDRPGMRIGVSQGSTSFGTLSRELKHASLTQAPNVETAIQMLAQHQLDAYATNKGILFQMSDSLPGSQVLAGRWGLEQFAIAIPKGRERGMEFVRKFVEEPATQELVARAARRAGLRGTAKVEAR